MFHPEKAPDYSEVACFRPKSCSGEGRRATPRLVLMGALIGTIAVGGLHAVPPSPANGRFGSQQCTCAKSEGKRTVVVSKIKSRLDSPRRNGLFFHREGGN